MNASTVLVWEDRLTRLAFVLLLAAITYGVFAGAVVTLYYDVVPNMGTVEDSLGQPLFILFLLAVLISLTHLPLAVADARAALWRQALIRLGVSLAPLIIFLGTDGLIAHALWWDPISDTDRFHLLHHSLLAGVPLVLGYGLALRWLWRPATFQATLAPSLRVWLISGIGLIWMMMGLGLVVGMVSPILCGATVLVGLLALLIIWRTVA